MIKVYNCLSIKQPYINEIICGVKKFEYRNWKTKFRGDMVICSTAKPVSPCDKNLPCGVALAIVELTDIVPVAHEHYKYGWVFKNIRKIEPIEIKGKLSIYRLSLDLRLQNNG